MTRMTGPDCVVMCNLINTHTHTHTHTPWEDQCEWHRMTRMTGPDCAVMCNLINTHTHTHTHTHSTPQKTPQRLQHVKRRRNDVQALQQLVSRNNSRMTSEPLDAQGQIPEMENLFEEATVKAVIKKVDPQSAAGPSGLRYSHLQAALCDELVEDLAAFATLVFSSRVLPQVFWTLHTSANLSALGQKARPVACGDALRRVIGAVFCRRYGRKLEDYFQPWGQYGVAVSGGVEIMEFTATLGF